MKKKYSIMGIFAHPDDETFGPGGTLAKYAAEGNAVSVVCVTQGQAGQDSGVPLTRGLGYQRKIELQEATKVLGVSSVTVLDFYDGTLNEQKFPLFKQAVEKEVLKAQPDIIIVYEREGISHHLDHIAVTKAVIDLFDEGLIHPKKIYYFGIPKQFLSLMKREGRGLDEKKMIAIDISKYRKIKILAMKQHATQKKDWERIIDRWEKTKQSSHDFGDYEYFELARTTLKCIQSPELDLLEGLT